MSLLSFRSVCINVLLNSGIGAEFFMTCTFGIGMLYSDISLFTYVQIVVYFLNAAFQFYTSKVIRPVRRGSCAYFGGAQSWSATGLGPALMQKAEEIPKQPDHDQFKSLDGWFNH